MDGLRSSRRRPTKFGRLMKKCSRLTTAPRPKMRPCIAQCDCNPSQESIQHLYQDKNTESAAFGHVKNSRKWGWNNKKRNFATNCNARAFCHIQLFSLCSGKLPIKLAYQICQHKFITGNSKSDSRTTPPTSTKWD